MLERFGFDLRFLGRTGYVLTNLKTLKREDAAEMRQAFIRNSHTRFLKSFSYHLPFGTKDAYVKEIMAANLNRLVNLMRICGFLMQTRSLSDLGWECEVDLSFHCSPSNHSGQARIH